jgi:hypothetical protein
VRDVAGAAARSVGRVHSDAGATGGDAEGMMTPQQKIAREVVDGYCAGHIVSDPFELRRRITAALAEEREACAQVAEAKQCDCCGYKIAANIRARR